MNSTKPDSTGYYLIKRCAAKNLKAPITILLFVLSLSLNAQDYGDFPLIEQDKLHRDLDLLYQGLDKFHTGMYWYTTKEVVHEAFEEARLQGDRDMNLLEFHKIIAPLVALSNEDHTDIYFDEATYEDIRSKVTYLPLVVKFLGEEMYCYRNASKTEANINGKRILSINGESPKQIVEKMGKLFASDGYINPVKYHDLKGLGFSQYYYYHYGIIPSFKVEFEDETFEIEALGIKEISTLLSERPSGIRVNTHKDILEFKITSDNIAYLGIHDFDNDEIKKSKVNNSLKSFLHNSFKTIEERNVQHLILDISKNTGGSEGNEGLVYSGDTRQRS